jgi:hypothetical protein
MNEMDGLKVITSSTRMPSTIVSSARHPMTTTSDLKTTTENLLTTVAAASIARVSFDRTTSSRLLSSHARLLQWARVRDALSVQGVAAMPGHSAKSHAVTPHADHLAVGANANGPVDAAPANPPEPKASTSRMELTIDSLRTYELAKPIPVLIEALGERHYVAEVPGLNMSVSASNLSEILVILKDNVTRTYDELRIRKNPDMEQARQLKALEGYIGRSKRGWLDRR